MHWLTHIVILLICIAGVTLSYFATRSKKFKFSLDDMFLDRYGKTSMSKFSLFVALVVSTWGFVALVQNGNMSEWYMTAYIGAFVVNGLGSKFIGSKDATS